MKYCPIRKSIDDVLSPMITTFFLIRKINLAKIFDLLLSIEILTTCVYLVKFSWMYLNVTEVNSLQRLIWNEFFNIVYKIGWNQNNLRMIVAYMYWNEDDTSRVWNENSTVQQNFLSCLFVIVFTSLLNYKQNNHLTLSFQQELTYHWSTNLNLL